MQNINNKKESGYTIIETMIAISLFIVIVMAGMGALLNANLLHKKSQSMRSVMDSLSFIMDDMSKNLRTGYNYYCIIGNDNLSNVSTTKSSPIVGGIPQNCWGIAFECQDPVVCKDSNPNDQWVYYISLDGKLFKSTLGPYNVTSSYTQLTPDEIVIDTVASSFVVTGAEPYPGNNQQPFVIIKLVGEANVGGVKSPFSLQTSVSQRAVDI